MLSDGVRAQVHRWLTAGHTRVYIVVPAQADNWMGWTWEENAEWRVAEARLAEAQVVYTAMGATVDGKVVGHDIYAAVNDLLREHEFTELVVSTLAPGVSAWLGLDLPRRLARSTRRRVTHVWDHHIEKIEGRAPYGWEEDIERYGGS